MNLEKFFENSNDFIGAERKLVEKLGLREAIFLTEINKCIKDAIISAIPARKWADPITHGERTWVCRTIEEWGRPLGISRWKSRQCIDNLKRLGILQTKSLDKSKFFTIYHCTIDYDKLEQILEKID